MRKKIETLSPAQQSRLAEIRDQWIAIGLSTAPADRVRAEQAIKTSYRLSGLACPQKIIWCGSPLSQGLTRALILDDKLDSVRDSVRASVWASVGASVRASVGDSVRHSVRASVGDSVRHSVRASVWASVGDSVRDSVGDSVGASVRASVGDSVRDSVRASVRASVWDSVYGQHDAGWLSFYRYFYEVCGLTKETEKLAGLWELAHSAGWALSHQNICWVSERHHVLTRDEQGRLHNLDGPSVVYPDGWKIYAVHGVRVPEFVIERPTEITTTLIHAERNVEIRRVMVQQYGTSRYLIDAGAKPIHADKYGTLYRMEQGNDEPIVMVKVVNSTPEPCTKCGGVHTKATKWLSESTPIFDTKPYCSCGEPPYFKDYWLRVPSDMRTAHDAVAWTFGITAEEYQPLFES